MRELITMALEDAQFKVRETMVEQIPDLPSGLIRFTVMQAMKDDRAEIRKTALEKLPRPTWRFRRRSWSATCRTRAPR